MHSTESHAMHWVLLRGLARGSAHWGDFGQRLQHQLGDARVTLLDVPGNGSLAHLRSPACIEDMVAHCRQQLATLQVRGPVVLVGLSMGGMVATAWAQTAPQEVQALVLINSSMRPYAWPWERLRPASYPTLLRMALHARNPLRWEQGVFQLTSRQADSAVVYEWVRIRQARAPSLANVVRQLWAAARYAAKGQRPPVPVLVLASRHDGLVSVRCSQRLAHAWNVPVHLHPQAGHDLPLDAPQWLIGHLVQWAASAAVTEISRH